MAKVNHMVMGVQSSGKTTFAAALWYLIDSREIETVLRKGQHNGDFLYLETIANNWAAGWQVIRTPTNAFEPIRINLKQPGRPEDIDLNFIDLSGETFERIFATRTIDGRVESLFEGMDSLLLFVSAIRKKDDMSILDIGLAMPEAMPPEAEDDGADQTTQTVKPNEDPEFTPGRTPQQVQIVDLLQSIADAPMALRPSRIAVIISAWDKAPPVTPDIWLKDRMPLLYQYLINHELAVPFRIYGVSAQGGSLPKRETPDIPSQRTELLKVKVAGQRIKVVGHGAGAHDLTHPIQWLSGLED